MSDTHKQDVVSLWDALRHVESWMQSAREIGEVGVIELRPHEKAGFTAIYLSLCGTTFYNRLLIRNRSRILFKFLVSYDIKDT